MFWQSILLFGFLTVILLIAYIIVCSPIFTLPPLTLSSRKTVLVDGSWSANCGNVKSGGYNVRVEQIDIKVLTGLEGSTLIPSRIIITGNFRAPRGTEKLKFAMEYGSMVDARGMVPDPRPIPSPTVQVYVDGRLVGEYNVKSKTIDLRLKGGERVKVVFITRFQNEREIDDAFTIASITCIVKFIVLEEVELPHKAKVEGDIVIHTVIVPGESGIIKVPEGLRFKGCQPNTCTYTNGMIIVSNTPRGDTTSTTVTVILESDNLLSNLRLNPERDYYLLGEDVSVTTPDNTEVTIKIYDKNGRLVSSKTGRSFTVPDKPGEYRVEFSVVKGYRVGYATRTIRVTTVTVDVGAPMRVPINSEAVVKFKVRFDADGSPVAGAKISLGSTTVTTDENGVAVLKITETTSGVKTYSFTISYRSYRESKAISIKWVSVNLEILDVSAPESGGYYWSNSGSIVTLRVRVTWSDGVPADDCVVKAGSLASRVSNGVAVLKVSGRDEILDLHVQAWMGEARVDEREVSVKIVFTAVIVDAPKQIWVNEGGCASIKIKAYWSHDGSPVSATLRVGDETVVTPGNVKIGGKPLGVYTYRVELVSAPNGITAWRGTNAITVISTFVRIEVSPEKSLAGVNSEVKVFVKAWWGHNGQPVEGAAVRVAGVRVVTGAKGSAVAKITSNRVGDMKVTGTLLSAPHSITKYVSNEAIITWTDINLRVEVDSTRLYMANSLVIRVEATWAHNGEPISSGAAWVEGGPKATIKDGVCELKVYANALGEATYEIYAESMSIRSSKPARVTVTWVGFEIEAESEEVWANSGGLANVTLTVKPPEGVSTGDVRIVCLETGDQTETAPTVTFSFEGSDEVKTVTFVAKEGERVVSNTVKVRVVFTRIRLVAEPPEIWTNAGGFAEFRVKAFTTHNNREVSGVRFRVFNRTYEAPTRVIISLPLGVYEDSIVMVGDYRGVTEYIPGTVKVVFTCVKLKAVPSTLEVNGSGLVEIRAIWVHDGSPVERCSAECIKLGTYVEIFNGTGTIELPTNREAAYHIVPIVPLEGVSCFEEAVVRVLKEYVVVEVLNYTGLVQRGGYASVDVYCHWRNGTPFDGGTVYVEGTGVEEELKGGRASLTWREDAVGLVLREVSIKGVDRIKPAVLEIVSTGLKVKVKSVRSVGPGKYELLLDVTWIHDGSELDNGSIYLEGLALSSEVEEGRAKLTFEQSWLRGKEFLEFVVVGSLGGKLFSEHVKVPVKEFEVESANASLTVEGLIIELASKDGARAIVNKTTVYFDPAGYASLTFFSPARTYAVLCEAAWRDSEEPVIYVWDGDSELLRDRLRVDIHVYFEEAPEGLYAIIVFKSLSNYTYIVGVPAYVDINGARYNFALNVPPKGEVTFKVPAEGGVVGISVRLGLDWLGGFSKEFVVFTVPSYAIPLLLILPLVFVALAACWKRKNNPERSAAVERKPV